MLYNANYNLILCGNQNILLIFANMRVKGPNWLLPDEKHYQPEMSAVCVVDAINFEEDKSGNISTSS